MFGNGGLPTGEPAVASVNMCSRHDRREVRGLAVQRIPGTIHMVTVPVHQGEVKPLVFTAIRAGTEGEIIAPRRRWSP